MQKRLELLEKGIAFSRVISDACRNAKLLAAISDFTIFKNDMGNGAYKDFLAHVSKMPGGKASSGFVYAIVIYDAKKPNRSCREFFAEGLVYVGHATNLAARANHHRKNYLLTTFYESD